MQSALSLHLQRLIGITALTSNHTHVLCIMQICQWRFGGGYFWLMD